MVTSISSHNINSLQFYRATNAFKQATPKQESLQPKVDEPQTSSGVDFEENSLLNKIDVDEVKKYAQSMGEENLSANDIKYGLVYGRSVIVDYLVG